MKTSERSLIVSRFCAAYDARENTGGMLHTVCDAVSKVFGDEMPDDDVLKTLKSDICRERGWKDEKVVASRTSEIGIIVKAATQNLSSAITQLNKKGKRDWHTIMKAARKLAKGESVSTAVQFALDTSVGNGGAVSANGRVAAGLKALYEESRGERRACVLKALRILQSKFTIKASWADE